MINYCMNCVTWDEAKPIIDMIEKSVGQNAPPYLVAAIAKVKNKFGQMIYGHTVKAKRVVLLQKTVDIHPPKTGISVHFSDSFILMALQI